MAPAKVSAEANWRGNFTLMAFVFSLCQATVTTPMGFATSMLSPEIGAIGTGLVYLVATTVALVVAAPLCSVIGPKKCLVGGQVCSTVYATLFAFAVWMPRGSSAQWAFYLLGAVTGGFSSGMLLTAQGVFLTRTVAAVAKLEGVSPENVSAELAGRFASIILVLECVVKTLASLLQGKFLTLSFGGPVVDFDSMFFTFAGVAALSTATMTLIAEPPAAEAVVAKPGLCDKLRAAFELWSSPVVWCLGVMNVLFGFCAAYMNGFVNGSFASQNPVFGTGSIGSLGAGVCIVAAITAEVFARLSKRIGKGPVMAVGAAAFFAIPLAVLIGQPSQANAYWGEGLGLLYLLQGVGRGVYESTNKAVFTDFFPGRLSVGAFANVAVQCSVGFFSSFAMQGFLRDGTALGYVVLTLAALVMPCFGAAWHFRLRAEAAARDSTSPLLAA